MERSPPERAGQEAEIEQAGSGSAFEFRARDLTVHPPKVRGEAIRGDAAIHRGKVTFCSPFSEASRGLSHKGEADALVTAPNCATIPYELVTRDRERERWWQIDGGAEVDCRPARRHVAHRASDAVVLEADRATFENTVALCCPPFALRSRGSRFLDHPGNIANALDTIATGLLSLADSSVTRPKLMVRPSRTTRASASTSDEETARMKWVVWSTVVIGR